MPLTLTVEDLPARNACPPQSGVRVWWLGQAGFLLKGPDSTVVIDPYLSDSLATKYQGREFPHLRMMEPPVLPGELRDVTHVFSTHGHTDHLDPGTIPGIAAASPRARFIVPRAVTDLAVERGVPEDRLSPIDSGESLEFSGPLEVQALPSAHEEIQTDKEGHHLFLGYVFRFGGVSFYHSGDTVPYPGLAERIVELGADVALLPINGRDEFRSSRGVPGNLTVAEAHSLAAAAGTKYLVCHHWGMFGFNTVDPDKAQRELAGLTGADPVVEAFLPQPGKCYHWQDDA